MALGPLAGLAREDFAGAIGVMLRQTATNPNSAFKAMSGFTEDAVKIMTGKSDLAPDPKDKRFMDPAWTFNPFFKAGAQYYLAVQKGIKGWIEDLELDALERDRANFVSQMVIDALAPTNSLIGNPTAQKRLVDSGGLSLIKGLQNAYNDMVHNDGMVSQVNKKPFKLGENIATTPGKVVFRRRHVRADPICARNRGSICDPATDHPAADQQNVHQRSVAGKVASSNGRSSMVSRPL
jgi:polyhydroxyalkanoate synthase